jgi:uncharacterized protein YndB with AHSA1/START domain
VLHNAEPHTKEPVITITAPAQQIFDALTDPEHLVKW